MMCGDFNDVLSQDEKWGLKPASLSRIRDFKNCLDTCGLVDMGFTSQKFSWFNKRANGQAVFQRIDRFVGNVKFMDLFPDAVISHLPRIKSGHNLILFSSKPFWLSHQPRPFRCERIWISQPDFISLARNVWLENSHIMLVDILCTLKEKTLLWNKNFFGNIFQRNKRLFARLQGINNALSFGHNSFLKTCKIVCLLNISRSLF